MSQNDALAAMFAAQKGPVAPERMRTTMEAYLDSWRRNDPEARFRLFVDEPVVEDPVGTPAYRGREAVREFWKHAAWPGVEFDAELHKLIACGREALAHFTIRLTGGGRPPMNIEVHETVRFADDGRISELRAYWNQSNLSVEG
jgi:steroid delta-isomerase